MKMDTNKKWSTTQFETAQQNNGLYQATCSFRFRENRKLKTYYLFIFFQFDINRNFGFDFRAQINNFVRRYAEEDCALSIFLQLVHQWSINFVAKIFS
jgi:hypothetical protein